MWEKEDSRMTPGFGLGGWVHGGSSFSPHLLAPSLASMVPPPGSLSSPPLNQVLQPPSQPFPQRCLRWP